jgi:hypothetical protein
MDSQIPVGVTSRKMHSKVANDYYDIAEVNRQTPPRSQCMLNALKEANAISIFSTSFPFAAMATKRRWSAYCFVRFLHHILLVLSAQTWDSREVAHGMRFRLTILRDGAQYAGPLQLNAAHLGLMRHGKEYTTGKQSVHNSSVILVEFAATVEIDSWYWAGLGTDNSNSMDFFESKNGPFGFSLEKSDYGQTWQIIDASSVFVSEDGERRLRSAPVERRSGARFSGLGLPWQIKALYQTKNAFEGLCFLWLCSCYFTRCYLSARTGAALCYLAGAAAAAAFGSSFVAERGYSANCGVFLLRGAGLLLTGGYLLHPAATPLVAAPLDAAVQLAITAAQSTLLDWAPAALLRPGRLLSFPQLCAAAAVGYWYLHRRAVEDASVALVLSDKLRYDFWFEVLAVKSADALARLDAAVAAHRARRRLAAPPGPCRQRTAAGAPVTSLRELYRQAAVADRLLRRKLLAWGAASGALMPASTSPAAGGGGGCGGAAGQVLEPVQPRRAMRLGWVGLKGEERAMEKMYRRYGGDAGRLLDVCRQSLVYGSVDGVTDGLEAMVADGDVVVERIKNRLDPGYDALQSCGYRCVCVCVCVRTVFLFLSLPPSLLLSLPLSRT